MVLSLYLLKIYVTVRNCAVWHLLGWFGGRRTKGSLKIEKRSWHDRIVFSEYDSSGLVFIFGLGGSI